MILVGTTVFVATMVGLARTYRRMAFTLVGAALLPWIANAPAQLRGGSVHPPRPHPFLFVVTGGVLVWGVFRERLLNLSPLARGVIVDTMTTPCSCWTPSAGFVDVNPAGSRMLGGTRPQLIGRRLDDLLPQPADDPTAATRPPHGATELSLGDRMFDVRRQALTDRSSRTRRGAGGPAGHHRAGPGRAAPARSPGRALPDCGRSPGEPGPGRAARDTGRGGRQQVRACGDGREIGGDFFDVFTLGDDRWGLVLGDVSGKGAEAAAVTALARYTLRTLASARHRPSRTLRELNARLLAATDVERHCTWSTRSPDRTRPASS
jgi:PAS domain-containing protein